MKNRTITRQWKKLLLINLGIVLVVFFAFLSLGKHETVSVTAMAMNVRTGPGVDNDISAQVKRGDELVVLKKENKWLQVRLKNRQKGWVASWLIGKDDTSPATNIAAKVNTQDTKLREEPNTEGEEITTLKKNKKVMVTSEQGGWSKVTVGQQEGWIHSSLLALLDDSKEKQQDSKNDQLFARQDDTKIRQEPRIDGEQIATINYGESVTFKKSQGDWYQVETTDGITGYVANWVVNFEELDKENQKKITSIAEATIVLDPGHGGTDVGAISNDGTIYEKVVTLATAHYVQEELEKLGANVILTRDDDSFVELSNIALRSNREKADAFISFHYDSTEISNQASGFTTYYYNKDHLDLATVVNNHLEKELPLPNRGVEVGDYLILRDNQRPALLLELGFMNNDSDAHTFKTKKFQRSVAKAVKNGLVEYFED